MKALEAYLLPYTISQVLAWAIFVTAWRNTRLARLFLFLVFAWAAATNLTFSIRRPEAYLDYANLAIPLYRRLISGWFSQHVHQVVPAIAAGQLLIAVGMVLKQTWVRLACAGAIIFLVSIAPLGVGSAFPCTLVLAAAAARIWQRDDKQLLWRRRSQPEKKNLSPVEPARAQRLL